MRHKLVSLSLALAASACAQMQNPARVVDVPDEIRGAPNESLAMIAAAKGVQIYECRAGAGGDATQQWAFVAPEADLFDAGGNRIGRHYAGPQWESLDGSRIAGTPKERRDAPQAGAIPWLLLGAKSVGGEGAFSKVTSVQRVNTVGGVAPAFGCEPSSVGMVARVPYTADYYFLTASTYAGSPARRVADPAYGY